MEQGIEYFYFAFATALVGGIFLLIHEHKMTNLKPRFDGIDDKRFKTYATLAFIFSYYYFGLAFVKFINFPCHFIGSAGAIYYGIPIIYYYTRERYKKDLWFFKMWFSIFFIGAFFIGVYRSLTDVGCNIYFS